MARWIHEDIESWTEKNGFEFVTKDDLQQWASLEVKRSYQTVGLYLADRQGAYTHELQTSLPLNNVFSRVARINEVLNHEGVEVIARAYDGDGHSRSFRWYIVKKADDEKKAA